MRISDWSSDVCSSDLFSALPGFPPRGDRGVAGKRVGAFVVGVAGMALDPHPIDPVALGGGDERLPELGVRVRFLGRGLSAVIATTVYHSGAPVHSYAAVGGGSDVAAAHVGGRCVDTRST